MASGITNTQHEGEAEEKIKKYIEGNPKEQMRQVSGEKSPSTKDTAQGAVLPEVR